MILIADSGSTKTEWALIENGRILKQFFSKGMNPFFQTEDEIKTEIRKSLIPDIDTSNVTHIHFYGAGCSFPERKAQVKNALVYFFSNAAISVESDLLGAAHALLGNERGIACILGTGSNSCFFDGNDIVENVSPLGYILGDEGSGAAMGKTFVADILKNQLPTTVCEKFLHEYQLTPALILNRVYRQAFPNRFLASFMPFLSANLHEPAIYEIVYNSFLSFLVRNVMQYDYQNYPASFTGSVAYYFAPVLRKAAADCGVSVHKIEKSPVGGLVQRYL